MPSSDQADSAARGRRWLDLTAEYTEAEDAVMAELRHAGLLHELEVVHLLKSLCAARIVA